VPLLPGPPALWWSVRLINWGTRIGINTGTFTELDPPPGYDPYTGEVSGSHGPFVTEEGNVLYTGGPEGRACTLVWTRESEDVCTATLHFLNITAGAVDTTWTTGDFTGIEARLDTFWGSVQNRFPAPAAGRESITLDRYRWHKFGAGITRPNPAVRETSKLLPGTYAGGPLPPQCSMSVTLKTAVRRSWGRIYLPQMGISAVNELGRFGDIWVDSVRTAFGTAMDGWAADQTPLVVWRPRKGGDLLKVVSGHLEVPDATSSALSDDTVQVDDIVDVIRSRRYDRPLRRSSHTLT